MTAGPTADQTNQDTAFTLVSPLAALDWWKGRSAQMEALYADMLSTAEIRLHKQAEFLGELSRCKSLPEVLGTQTTYVQDVLADAMRDAQRALADSYKAFGGDA